MKPTQIIAGVVAGAVGAAAWAAVAHFMNLEIGYLAWGIGALVGVAIAAAGEASAAAGVLAVLITAASICIGKFAVVEISVNNAIGEAAGGWNAEASDITYEDLHERLAGQIAQQREEAGEEIQWPEVSGDEESMAASYPADIWKEAGQQLSAMSADEKDVLRENMQAEFEQAIEELKDVIAGQAVQEGFLASFGIMDLLFFGLAVASAWGIATGATGD